MSCSSNPECGWCPSDGICYLRTLTAKCASNLKTMKCPGICPTLPNCQSCIQFSQTSKSNSVSQIIDDLNFSLSQLNADDREHSPVCCFGSKDV